MLAAEVRPEIRNLPHSQCDQHPHSPNSKPLDSLIRTLIRISQFHLPSSQIIQFIHDFLRDFTDSTKFCFYRFEFLSGLDCTPVFRIGAYVDVEFYVSRRLVRGCAVLENVFETDVEGQVVVGGECVAALACYVAGMSIVVSCCVFDLYHHHHRQLVWMFLEAM